MAAQKRQLQDRQDPGKRCAYRKLEISLSGNAGKVNPAKELFDFCAYQS
jgi:hypothetical protein